MCVWGRSLLELFTRVELLALPTLPTFAPRIDELTADSLVPVIIELTRYTSLFNAAGLPCTAQPVRVQGSRLPASSSSDQPTARNSCSPPHCAPKPRRVDFRQQ
jgi:Asp-tRNA(Asn)/Glu-tRNA(Gln) amidotransferase A subunit family amidase